MPNIPNVIQMRVIYSLLLSPLLLSSCTKSTLSVQTDYITYKHLASYHVGTPDPRNNFPVIGQRLIISWSLPKRYLSYPNLHLHVTIRFRNREELIEAITLSKSRGTYVYTLLNDEYLEKRGILTYKIDLIGSGEVLEEWRHQIWAELIEVSDRESKEIPTSEDETDLDIDWDEDEA